MIRKVYLDENSSLHLRTEVTTRKYEPSPAHKKYKNIINKSYDETGEISEPCELLKNDKVALS